MVGKNYPSPQQTNIPRQQRAHTIQILHLQQIYVHTHLRRLASYLPIPAFEAFPIREILYLINDGVLNSLLTKIYHKWNILLLLSYGSAFMEYLEDYGHFEDVPMDFILENMKAHYSHLVDLVGEDGVLWF